MKFDKKKYIHYFIVLTAGVLLGWLIFGRGSSGQQDTLTDSEHSESEAEWWTCSMHPQIQQQEPGNCPICGMKLIPMKSGTTDTGPGQIEMSESAVKSAKIQTSFVELSQAEKEIFLQGKVLADERRISVQPAHFSGRIEKLYIAFEGEKVYAGQKLAVIYSPQLVTAQKELFEALKSIDTYPQLAEAARNKLKLWKLTDKQISEIENSGKVTEYFDVLADVSGYVTKLNISVGDYVKTGDVLFETVDLNKVWIVFDAYEKDLPFLKIGDKINFTVSSLADKSYETKISYIDPVIDPVKRTASVRTEINNRGSELKPEMFVSGKLSANLSHKKDALTVPKSAVMWTGKRSIVYVKVPNTEFPLFELREVSLGESLGNFYVITGGLKEGEEIVTNGTYTIDAAAQLNNKYSMMNPPDDLLKNVVPDYVSETPAKFKDQISRVLTAYLSMTESFVAADAGTVKKEASLFKNALTSVDMELIKGDAHQYWMTQLKVLNENIKKIIETNNIDTQRKAFKPFSAAMINVMKSFGVNKQTVYVQFCPMADDNKGGFWLSAESKILNPYFGDMMLHCGETKDTIQ